MDHTSINANRPPYGILAILMIGAFITFLNNTLLNVALPSIMSDLQVDTATVQWLTTGFMLVNGIMIPTTAFLIQKYTVRRLFIVAMSLFSIGTVMAGIAHAFPILLSARMVQASGSAIMMPLLMNVMLVSFPVAKRGAAMGMFGLILMFAPAIGPTLSGWIVEHYNWRMLFYFVAPISIGILIATSSIGGYHIPAREYAHASPTIEHGLPTLSPITWTRPGIPQFSTRWLRSSKDRSCKRANKTASSNR